MHSQRSGLFAKAMHNIHRIQGRTRNRTRDLPKKGSAFMLSCDHWTGCRRLRPCVAKCWSYAVLAPMIVECFFAPEWVGHRT